MGRWRASSLFVSSFAAIRKTHQPNNSYLLPRLIKPLLTHHHDIYSIIPSNKVCSFRGFNSYSSPIFDLGSTYDNDEHNHKYDEEYYVHHEDENDEDQLGKISVKAIFLCTSVDLKGLQFELSSHVVRPTSRSTNHIALRFCNYNSDYMEIGVEENPSSHSYMVVFQYGSAVLFNVEDHEIESYLAIIRRHASGSLKVHEMRKDDYVVKEKPLLREEMQGGPDYIVLKHVDIDSIRIISSVLGQSIALDYHVSQVDGMVEEFTDINRVMEKTGTFTMDRKKLFQLVGKANSNLADVILKVGLFDSSRAEEVQASPFYAETNFYIAISLTGLLLLAMIIGTMETYIESRTARLEEYRIQQMDTEEWMNYRQLPHAMKERVRKHDLYKWIKQRKVDEEAILDELPLDVRRDIKHYICIELVRRVPLFDQMDERTVDAICERLSPVICTSGTCLLREGDPTNEMLFIMHGQLDSYTTDGGRANFWNQCQIGPGDFCGEELLTWALDPRSKHTLPLSTRTVTSVSEVEAYALSSEDIKFVATQFRRMRNKKLRHTFRVHSHQWRTWAACYIQSAWKAYRRRKLVGMLKDNHNHENLNEKSRNKARLRKTALSLTLATNIRKGETFESDDIIRTPVPKPKDPDYFD